MRLSHLLGTLTVATMAFGIACSSNTSGGGGSDASSAGAHGGQGGTTAKGGAGGATGSGGLTGSGAASGAGGGSGGTAGSIDGSAGAQCGPSAVTEAFSTSIAGTWDFTPAGGAKRTLQVPGGGWAKQGVNAASGTYATQI
ncbi:MAG TPA: hypothetical protein VF395_12600, partial [Polyangiaceae bacterium]